MTEIKVNAQAKALFLGDLDELLLMTKKGITQIKSESRQNGNGASSRLVLAIYSYLETAIRDSAQIAERCTLMGIESQEMKIKPELLVEILNTLDHLMSHAYKEVQNIGTEETKNLVSILGMNGEIFNNKLIKKTNKEMEYSKAKLRKYYTGKKTDSSRKFTEQLFIILSIFKKFFG